jgi:hypothetical protein
VTDRAKTDLPSRKSTPSDFRLPKVLAKRRKIEGGNAALARAISSCWRDDPAGKSEAAGKDVIDRRKLTLLIDEKPGLVLSVKDLRVLDCYLERFGEGLAFRPLFEKPDVMRTLANSGHVTFLLTSKVEEEGGSFSHWDVLAMAEIQRSITAASDVSVQLDIQNVPFYPDELKPKSAIEGSWPELFEERGPSLIALASNRTNPAAEVMQCAMFGRSEFEGRPKKGERKLPLHFVWNPGLRYVFESQFHLGPEQLEALDLTAAQRISSQEASAIEFGGKVYLDRSRSPHGGATYGVCFAQRRKHGQVWMLLAGLTGAATFAAAKIAKRLPMSLQAAKPADVHCFLIQAHVEPPRQPNSLERVRDSSVELVRHKAWQGSLKTKDDKQEREEAEERSKGVEE